MDVPTDDKDWTWVLDRPCPECGFDAASVQLGRASELLAAATSSLLAALDEPDARLRPQPTTWSPTEYACHVRDTLTVFCGRIQLVLEQDDPTFPNWDQDATAIEQQYDQQDPRTVASELQHALAELSMILGAIPHDAWARPAQRSNGSRFTLESLVRYLVHDPVHHAHDVAVQAGQSTVNL